MLKKTIRKFVILNAVLIAWVLIFFLAVDKVALIISVGVRAADLILVAAAAATAIVFVGGNLLIFARNRRVLFPPKVKKVVLTSGKDAKISPDNVRRDLKTLIDSNTGLSSLLSEGIAQMDSIDKKQAKLGEILERNDSGVLKQVADSIDEAEVSLCANLTKIIDRAIMLNSLEQDSSERAAVYSENVNRISQILKANSETLSLCDVLLTESINYLDDKNESGGGGDISLEAMTTAIKTIRTMNGHEA
jgi:flagellar hook-basal body complex protein FliE